MEDGWINSYPGISRCKVEQRTKTEELHNHVTGIFKPLCPTLDFHYHLSQLQSVRLARSVTTATRVSYVTHPGVWM